MEKVLAQTNLNLPQQTSVYHGKVRDVYTLKNDLLVMVATDRISAFDVVLPKGIPYKGQVLNQITNRFLDASEEIVPNWKIASPDPMVTIGWKCEPFPIEMIIRGYLTGSSWREYQKGERHICGVPIPNGMREHQAFAKPIITPTTKAAVGEHDENISREEIISSGLVSKEDYEALEDYTYKLFELGSSMARERGLILVDTKYEFGKRNGQIYLIDEVHTPDSSRYFYLNTYQERFYKGESQRQLSKEFVREWLMQNGFSGKPEQAIPEMNEDFITSVSQRYIELYEIITGESFLPIQSAHIEHRIKENILFALKDIE